MAKSGCCHAMPPMDLSAFMHVILEARARGSDWSFFAAPHVLRLACAAIVLAAIRALSNSLGLAS